MEAFIAEGARSVGFFVCRGGGVVRLIYERITCIYTATTATQLLHKLLYSVRCVHPSLARSLALVLSMLIYIFTYMYIYMYTYIYIYIYIYMNVQIYKSVYK